jgi:HEPN domain-containing protein
MTGSRRLQEVRDWLLSAREDLEFAEATAAGLSGQPRHACFSAQQAIEKILKAALIFSGVTVAKIHDLDELRDRLPAGWGVKVSHPSFGLLIEYAVAARYPDARLTITAAEAAQAVRDAREVWNSIAADLLKRGFDMSTELS